MSDKEKEILENLEKHREERQQPKKITRYLRVIDINTVHKKLLNVLSRDINFLLESSYHGPLTPTEASSLVDYLKLVKTLKEIDKDNNENLTNEQLEAIANNSKPSP